MNTLELLYVTDGIVFLFIMGVIVMMMMGNGGSAIKLHPREGFCTCRGAQYNNSSADVHQSNCYKNKIPNKIWRQSYAGCTSFDDPGKISWDYNIDQKQLPEFAGV